MGKIKNLFSKVKKLTLSHKKVSIPLIIVFIIVLIVVWPKGSKTILTDTAKYQNITKTVSITGKIDSENLANLTFQFGGKLIYLGAKEGDSVKKWQAIATLDTNQLQASLRQTQQDFTAAKAASDQYYDGHKNSTESYDEKVQRTALDAAQNKAYDQMMKVQQDLNNSTLYSPLNGILVRSGVNTTDVNVTPATIFTIVDPTLMVFKMDVDDADIGSVKVGQKVNLALDAFPDQNITLTIDKIDFVSHITSSGGNSFTVKASMPSSENFRIGMNGNADIIVSERDNVLVIPLSSITDDKTVYVKVGNTYEKRKVDLGLESDTLAEIKSGIKEGETVAVDPSSVPQNQVLK